MNSNYQHILDENLSADEIIKSFPNDPDHIREFRDRKLSILGEIMKIYKAAVTEEDHRGNLDLYKAGILAACQIAQTRIDEIIREDYRIMQPDVVDDDTRRICSEDYDALKAAVRSLDRMYMPDHLERNVPDASDLIALQKRFDGVKADAAKAKTANNKQFNLLFGSRG